MLKNVLNASLDYGTKRVKTKMTRGKNLSRTSWKDLTSKQKVKRKLSLEVLRNMRRGTSFSFATKEVGISSYLSKKNLGRYLRKKFGRFVPTLTDSIQRSMEFYSRKEGRIFIVVKNSKDASLIGEYFASVRQAMRTGDESLLKKFKRKTITDAEGKKHKFETDLEKIFEIEEGVEEPEFREIYEEVEL